MGNWRTKQLKSLRITMRHYGYQRLSAGIVYRFLESIPDVAKERAAELGEEILVLTHCAYISKEIHKH